MTSDGPIHDREVAATSVRKTTFFMEEGIRNEQGRSIRQGGAGRN